MRGEDKAMHYYAETKNQQALAAFAAYAAETKAHLALPRISRSQSNDWFERGRAFSAFVCDEDSNEVLQVTFDSETSTIYLVDEARTMNYVTKEFEAVAEALEALATRLDSLGKRPSRSETVYELCQAAERLRDLLEDYEV